MQEYEYKTLPLSVTGLRSRGSLTTDLEKELNAMAANGWRVHSVVPRSRFGLKQSLAILERAVREAAKVV